jgi:hypothetical protein
MMVPDAIRRCVCFVAAKDIAGSYRFCGTAFFVSTASASKVPLGHFGFAYVVTAKHVVDAISYLGCAEIYLRLNMQDGRGAMVSNRHHTMDIPRQSN